MSVSDCKLTILPDIQPANRIVIISNLSINRYFLHYSGIGYIIRVEQTQPVFIWVFSDGIAIQAYFSPICYCAIIKFCHWYSIFPVNYFLHLLLLIYPNTTIKQSRRQGGFWGLSPRRHTSESPKLKHETLQSVEFLSIFRFQAPTDKPKAPPQKRKASLLKTFWRRFCIKGPIMSIRHLKQTPITLLHYI